MLRPRGRGARTLYLPYISRISPVYLAHEGEVRNLTRALTLTLTLALALTLTLTLALTPPQVRDLRRSLTYLYRFFNARAQYPVRLGLGWGSD